MYIPGVRNLAAHLEFYWPHSPHKSIKKKKKNRRDRKRKEGRKKV